VEVESVERTGRRNVLEMNQHVLGKKEEGKEKGQKRRKSERNLFFFNFFFFSSTECASFAALDCCGGNVDVF